METVAIAAISLDGCITRHGESGTAFTSPADRDYFRQVLLGFDACVMGARTFDAARDGILADVEKAEARGVAPKRLRVVWTRQPARYAGVARPGALEFTDAGPAEISADLAARGRRRCALLGGADVYTAFFKRGLARELWITLEPLAFGRGTRLFGHATDLDLRFQLGSVQSLSNDTLLLRYRVAGA